MGPNNLQNEDDENTTESSDSDTNEMFSNEESANPSKKAKLICQFFYSSIEGDFHGQWLLFHYKKLTTTFFLFLYGKYICEAIGSLNLENGHKNGSYIWCFRWFNIFTCLFQYCWSTEQGDI